MIIIPNNETQGKQILEHLKEHGNISPLEALKLYGCMRLAPRICDLRKKGYIIRTYIIKKNGKRFARYVYEGHENDKR